MVKLTKNAREKIRKFSRKSKPEENSVVRLVPKSEIPYTFKLIWDKEKREDKVINNKMKNNILVIDNILANKLSGMIIDYYNSDYIVYPQPDNI